MHTVVNLQTMRRRLVVAVVLLNLLAAAIAAWASVERRATTYRIAEGIVENLTTVLAHDISTMLDKADDGLRTVLDTIARHGIDTPAARGIVKSTVALEFPRRPDLNALRIADVNGDVILGEGSPVTHAVNIADRDYFRQLKANPDAGLLVSEPLIARVGGRPAIILVRAFKDHRGNFAGVAYAAISDVTFRRLFAGIDIGANGAVALRKDNMALVVRYTKAPGLVSEFGSKEVSERLGQAIGARPKSGAFVASTQLDGVERSNAYRKLDKYPFYVIAGVATSDLRREWRSNLQLSILFLVLFSATTVLLAIATWRSLVRRENAEVAMADSEARFRMTFEFAPVGICLADAEGILTDVNKFVCRQSGYSRSDLLGANFLQFTHEDSRQLGAENLRKMVAGESEGFRGERLYLKKDGTPFWAEIATGIVRNDDGSPKYVIGTIEDISPRKKIEIELQWAKTELESKVIERTSNLVEANAELQNITYTLAHDLRAPARQVSRLSAQLMDSLGGTIPESDRHWLMLMGKSAKRQAMLVEDMLAYMKQGHKVVDRESVDMAALVRELIIIADEEGRDHGRIDWQVDDLPPADADRALLRLVLTNLLSNAIKYSAGIDDPAIHVGCIRIEGSPPCYFVRDNGVGFDPAKAGKLFGLFQRFHDPKKFSGHGIGLAIAKRAVDKHQGRIWAESSPGAGATFYFTLQTEPS